MNTRQLECFTKLAETLNFSRTAKCLYTTQPSVTYQINALENELKLKLFLRNKRRVELTSAGKVFYDDIREVLIKINIAVTKAKNYSQNFNSSLSVGYDSNINMGYIPAILRECKRKQPQIYIYLRQFFYEEKIVKFSNYKLDVIFTVKESVVNLPDVNYRELCISHFVCVLPVNHPFAGRKTVEIKDLQAQSLIVLHPLKRPSEMVCIQNEIQVQCTNTHIYFSDSVATAYAMIKGDMGIAVMPDFVCQTDNGLAIIPLLFEPSVSYGIAWHASDTKQETKKFIDITTNLYLNKDC